MDVPIQPLVSVITPVYNGEKYFVECIESVLAQTYENWEYIIVNNCSTDSSLEIAESYTKKDPRIWIQNNPEFVGVIQNHNLAFRQLSPESKYCKVVHADDWLFPDCIMQMVQVAETHPSIGIVGSYGLSGAWVKCDGLPYPSTMVPGREICRLTLLGQLYPFFSPSSLLIRSDLIRNRQAFYNEAHIYADVEACYEVLQQVDFGFVHQVLTYIRRHEESMTSLFAHRFNTIILAELYFLTNYGPIYLNNEEYRQVSKKAIKSYYNFLAESILHFREKQFWDTHRSELHNMGFQLSHLKIAKSLIVKLLEILLDPKRVIEAISRRRMFQRCWSAILSGCMRRRATLKPTE